MATCRACVASGVKNADKNALRLRPVTLCDQQAELMDFELYRRSAQRERDAKPCQQRFRRPLVGGEHAEAERDAAQQQNGDSQDDAAKLEDVLTRRSARELMSHDGEHREQRREDDAVGHQVQPEPEHGVRCTVIVVGSWQLQRDGSLPDEKKRLQDSLPETI